MFMVHDGVWGKKRDVLGELSVEFLMLCIVG